VGVEGTLMNDPRFATNSDRLEHREQLVSLLQPVFLRQDSSQWLETLTSAGIPCSPINMVDEALHDEQVLARQMVVELEHPLSGVVKSLGCPVHLSDTPPAYRLPPPLMGQHTEQILLDLGYGSAEVEQLRTQAVV
jgi:crotonobetainyl-CoA:carnitine CoA-transferase CaiB-like acyl-CoA transferase